MRKRIIWVLCVFIASPAWAGGANDTLRDVAGVAAREQVRAVRDAASARQQHPGDGSEASPNTAIAKDKSSDGSARLDAASKRQPKTDEQPEAQRSTGTPP